MSLETDTQTLIQGRQYHLTQEYVQHRQTSNAAGNCQMSQGCLRNEGQHLILFTKLSASTCSKPTGTAFYSGMNAHGYSQ